MTIATEDNRTAELTTDGIETEFDFDMLIHADTEVQVWYQVTDGNYTQLTFDTHYTVVFTEDGGTVTTIGGSSPYAAGKLLIIRHLALTQQTNWLYNDAHTEQTHQDDFDRSVMRDLQIQEQLDRSVSFAIHSGTFGIEFPEPDANKFIAWNAAGDGLENKTAAEGGAAVAEFDDLSDVDVEAPAAGDIARWTGAVWEKYPDSNYLPAQTIGIADDNLLEVDGTPNSGEYARFTANGLEGRTLAEFVGDFSLEIGVDVQAWDAQLDDIAALAFTNGNFIVGDGSNWIVESGNTARTSLGVGTGDDPTFAGLFISGQNHVVFQSENNYIFGYSISQLRLVSTGEIHLTAGGAYWLKVIHDLGCHFNAGIYITEQASAGSSSAAIGQVWVKDDAPNTLWFTDDADNDFQLGDHDNLFNFVANKHIDWTGATDDFYTTGKVRIRDDAAVKPTREGDGYISVYESGATRRFYTFVGGVRYYVNLTADAEAEPVVGNPIGLLLTLTYAA